MNLTPLNNEKYANLTAEAWGAWLLANAHCDTHNTRVMNSNQFLETTRMTSLETYNQLEDADLIEKTETGQTQINHLKETN